MTFNIKSMKNHSVNEIKIPVKAWFKEVYSNMQNKERKLTGLCVLQK